MPVGKVSDPGTEKTDRPYYRVLYLPNGMGSPLRARSRLDPDSLLSSLLKPAL
jgi:hypothetical protein